MLFVLQSYIDVVFRVVDEPTTMVTDYLIAVASIGFATSVARVLPAHHKPGWNLWVLGFVSVSMAAWVGGTMHGFRSSFGEGATAVMADVTGLLIGATGVLFIAAALASRIGLTASRWLVAGLVATLLGTGVLMSRLVLVPAFTRVDLYHCIQLVGLYFLCRGALLVGHGAGRYRRRQVLSRLGWFRPLGRRARQGRIPSVSGL